MLLQNYIQNLKFLFQKLVYLIYIFNHFIEKQKFIMLNIMPNFTPYSEIDFGINSFFPWNIEGWHFVRGSESGFTITVFVLFSVSWNFLVGWTTILGFVFFWIEVFGESMGNNVITVVEFHSEANETPEILNLDSPQSKVLRNYH